MLTEVMKHYGLARGLPAAGYYETEHHRQLCREVRAAILASRLVEITGMVGSGKTALLHHLQADLARENKVLVSKSPAVDQERTTIATLIEALFYDLSPEGDVKISKQAEKRKRELRSLFRRRRKPVALFVDEAHNLPPKTLNGLKRLMEVIADGGGRLSVVLAGHPKLRNDLRRPTMEFGAAQRAGEAKQQRPFRLPGAVGLTSEASGDRVTTPGPSCRPVRREMPPPAADLARAGASACFSVEGVPIPAPAPIASQIITPHAIMALIARELGESELFQYIYLTNSPVSYWL